MSILVSQLSEDKSKSFFYNKLCSSFAIKIEKNVSVDLVFEIPLSFVVNKNVKRTHSINLRTILNSHK